MTQLKTVNFYIYPLTQEYLINEIIENNKIINTIILNQNKPADTFASQLNND
jgi:hypothetical protein